MAPKRNKSSQNKKQAPPPPPRPTDLIDDNQPLSIDWNKEGIIISEIRRQQNSCVTEGIYNKQAKKKKKPLKAGSVQHLTNCVKPDMKNGSLLSLKKAYKFMERNRLAREEDLPFQGGRIFDCDPHQINWHQAIEVVGHTERTSEAEVIDEKEILKLLVEHPVAVTLENSPELSSCGPANPIYRGPTKVDVEPPEDHAMVLVGYQTTQDGINVFLARNSWGMEWGQAGIGMIIRQSSSGSSKSLFKSFSYPEVKLG